MADLSADSWRLNLIGGRDSKQTMRPIKQNEAYSL